MKIWILLLIAALLLVWSLSRERFEPTETIKSPPYNEAEQSRIFAMLSTTDQENLIKEIEKTMPPDLGINARNLAPQRATNNVAVFFGGYYAPASEPITQEQIDDFVRPYYGSPTEKEILRRLLKAYFIDQQAATSPAQSPPAGATTGTTTGTTAGGTTGGSSTSSAAPNAGPVANSGKGQLLYGPTYTSVGAPINMGENPGTDDSKYPELLGGVGDTTSVCTSAGIQTPSQSWLLSQSGSLPSTASLGCDANSGYLPYSRTPGDQDLIPDPYRLARNYSTASYSSKTDPVPFLTDFSAFFK